MDEMIRTSTSGRVAAFIAEPIQGVGGFITPPKEYFEIVTGIVKKFGGLFISDEVQTGWGRTGGKWFGIEHYGVTPDIITSAKGLGNGAPVGLTVARAGGRRWSERRFHFHFRRESGGRNRGESRDRFHRRTTIC